ncbi:hypothetical protein LEP1GSC186_3330 [Leptospira noguchii serovar Autumnalis str. ZUN142]|uniref:Uncharacterized protein n=1 Tax=Leptospira noguchii serovar Autumnalis str. ZUN142 TaxID=1085540 RepID=M6UBY7_9LEPT|nr:hypothetical protein LEP1GSC186_3330 [Leptospira noguchii serovar Autumnalis str. ZUN142]
MGKLNTTLSMNRVGNSAQRSPKGRVVGWELSFTENLS